MTRSTKTEETKDDIGVLLPPGEAADSPTAPLDLYSKLEDLNNTINALLIRYELNEAEHGRLQKVQELLTQIKEEIIRLARQDEFNEATKDLIPLILKIVENLNIRLKSLEESSDFKHAFTDRYIDLVSAAEIEHASKPGAEDWYKENVEHAALAAGAIGAVLSLIASGYIFLQFIAPHVGLGMICAIMFIIMMRLIVIPIHATSEALLSEREKFNDRHYPLIETLEKLTIKLSAVQSYLELPVLTADRIYQTVEDGSSPLLTEDFDGMTTFAFVENKSLLVKVCKTLIAWGNACLITKNQGTAGGYVIGTSIWGLGLNTLLHGADLHRTLQQAKVPFICRYKYDIQYRYIQYEKFTHYEYQAFAGDQNVSGKLYYPNLTLYSSSNFPGGVAFNADNIYVGPAPCDDHELRQEKKVYARINVHSASPIPHPIAAAAGNANLLDNRQYNVALISKTSLSV